MASIALDYRRRNHNSSIWLASRENRQQLTPPYMAQLFGIYQAVVVSAADPTGRRRLLVTVPEVLGAATLWALPCVPAGSRATPRAGALVWVQFEAGNAARPVWVGTRPGGP